MQNTTLKQLRTTKTQYGYNTYTHSYSYNICIEYI